MNYHAALLSAVCFFLFQTLTNAQTNDYAMWFQPGAQITKFSSTMVVPKVSTGSGYHAVWPGLENDADSFVFQNVISDSKVAGEWEFFVEYCCPSNTGNVEYTAVAVSPGDTITSTFSLDTSSSQWTDSWSISGSTSQSGSYPDTFSGVGTIDKPANTQRAVLAVELQSGGSWDFGQIQFSNIQVTATTTSTAWCGSAFALSGSFSYTVSGTSSSVSGSSVTCTYSNVLFTGPS